MRTFLFSIVFGFAMLLLFPVASYAAGIVPCDGVSINGQGVVCQTCHFVQLGTNILNWIVGVMATVCAVIIAVAGLKMATAGGNAGAVSAAKEMITNTIVGFIILLAAWLIIDTVMRVFVGDEVPNFGPWNEIQCLAPEDVYPEVTPSTPPVSDACATASNPDACRCEAGGGTWNLGTGVCEPGTAPTTGGTFVLSSSLNGAQAGHRSGALSTFESCVAGRLEAGTYTITSISDNAIANGTYTFEYCAARGQAGGCAHSAGSCHYGGRTCIGQSYALDIRTAGLTSSQIASISTAATACGGWPNPEGNHIHISRGQGCGCN